MKISIIGTGYVGLVTGVCLASKGYSVVSVDKKEKLVRQISQGESPIYEHGLESLLQEVLKEGLFSATTDLKKAILESEISIIAVETPSKEDDIDLTAIKEVVQEIAVTLGKKKGYHVIVVKSTVLPGTTEKVILPVLKKSSNEFGLCMNPEFLREGSAMSDFLNPDRIVIGALDQKSGDILERAYRVFDAPVIRTTLKTAEMIKYASNVLLATLISFSNEMANISSIIGGIDVAEVLDAVNLDRRISPKINGQLIKPEITSYLKAGCGFGGSCLPKDLKALIDFARKEGYVPQLLDAVDEINRRQPLQTVKLLEKSLCDLRGRRIAILGLAFKPDTDDMRASPAIPIVQALLKKDATVVIYDPVAMPKAKEIWLKDLPVIFGNSIKETLEGADGAIIVTGWREFMDMGPDVFLKWMNKPIVVDSRRIYDPEYYGKKITYLSIGRG